MQGLSQGRAGAQAAANGAPSCSPRVLQPTPCSRVLIPASPAVQEPPRSLILPGSRNLSSGSRESVITAGIRRSPVVVPDIVVGKGEEESPMDLYNYLLRQRIIFLAGYVNDKMATQIVGSLMALEAMDEEEEIRMYINSPGGQPYSIFGVLDAMATIKPPIQTLGLGACYSYASLILAAGTKGRRYAMKNTRIMMTQPMGGSQGDIYAIKRTVEELNAIYQLTARYYMQFTGMDQDTVERNTCRDFFMTPEDAIQQGLIDGVVRGKDDYTMPPSMVRQLRQAGLVDDLTPGMLQWE